MQVEKRSLNRKTPLEPQYHKNYQSNFFGEHSGNMFINESLREMFANYVPITSLFYWEFSQAKAIWVSVAISNSTGNL